MIDYTVSYVEVGNAENGYTVYSSGTTTTSRTVSGLFPGVTYRFVVQARNLVGLSEYSDIVDILAAQVPDAPTDLQNIAASTNANQISIRWVAPSFDGGNAIIDYRLWSDDATGTTFSVLEESLTVLQYVHTSVV